MNLAQTLVNFGAMLMSVHDYAHALPKATEAEDIYKRIKSEKAGASMFDEYIAQADACVTKKSAPSSAKNTPHPHPDRQIANGKRGLAIFAVPKGQKVPVPICLALNRFNNGTRYFSK